MLSLFKAAGAKDEDMRFVRDEYQCDHCMKQRKPVDRKKATMPRTLAFNRIVAVDTLYILEGGHTRLPQHDMPRDQLPASVPVERQSGRCSVV